MHQFRKGGVFMKGKFSRFTQIRILLTLAGILYPIAIFLIPSLAELQRGFLPWFFYLIYVLLLFFLWSISSRKTLHREDVDNRELNITKDLLKDRSKWYL